MLALLNLSEKYSNALLAQDALRHVIRILSDLTSKSRNPDSHELTADCIHACLLYLSIALTKKDGFSHVRVALQAGILPAILRCKQWIPHGEEGFSDILAYILHTISLYIIYPSVLRPFLASVQKVTALDLVDATHPICAKYLQLVHIVTERIAMVPPREELNTDLGVKCENCGAPDLDASFKSCSGCFLPSYCSEDCQKEHWKKHHETPCKEVQELRAAGKPLRVSPDDARYIYYFVMAQINRRRAEIVRVWKEENPTQTPLVSIDFTEDPKGVMTVGNRCLTAWPNKSVESFSPEDLQKHYEDFVFPGAIDNNAVFRVFLPCGESPHCELFPFGAKGEFLCDSEGLERLIKILEDGLPILFLDPLNMERIDIS
ncbi:hypothetical protein B0H11DRAFT_224649 [Mycena galericulata]|nr:hypothetical protein B0H11DRAFT_224649 [Mycena galericulata]